MLKRLGLVLAFAAAMSFGFISPAGAQDCSYPDNCDPDQEVEALPNPLAGDPLGPVAAPEAPVVVKGTQQLPITGAESTALVGAGVVLVLAGGLMVVRSRSVA